MSLPPLWPSSRERGRYAAGGFCRTAAIPGGVGGRRLKPRLSVLLLHNDEVRLRGLSYDHTESLFGMQ